MPTFTNKTSRPLHIGSYVLVPGVPLDIPEDYVSSLSRRARENIKYEVDGNRLSTEGGDPSQDPAAKANLEQQQKAAEDAERQQKLQAKLDAEQAAQAKADADAKAKAEADEAAKAKAAQARPQAKPSA